MREIKYTLPIVDLILVLTWVVCVFELAESKELKLWITLLFFISINSLNFGVDFWIKNQMLLNKMTFLTYKEKFLTKQLRIIFVILTFAFLMFLYFVTNLDYMHSGFLYFIFIIYYFGIKDLIFINDIKGLFFDQKGVFEKNWFKSEIKWNQIQSFKISNNELKIVSSNSEHLYSITQGESERIMKFMKKNELQCPTTGITNSF